MIGGSESARLRDLRLLLRLNQFDGFDCPGCAWPEPDGERSHAEFCENGAKAIAEEATRRQPTCGAKNMNRLLTPLRSYSLS